MVKTNNNWNMDIAKKFIREVKDWDDIESIDKLIDEYDKKYLNWNHDFPIFGFMSILKNGLLFPNIAFSGGVKKNGVGFCIRETTTDNIITNFWWYYWSWNRS